MTGFKKIIVLNNESLDFDFRKVYVPRRLKYFVTVRRPYKPMVSFEMEKTSVSWNIIAPAPTWVIELQDELVRIIKDHLKKGDGLS
ncbi:MAG: hypothetical protein J7502_09435 [Flavisolibacter sp.]|nr:hypothetical protein [Flavisolibacter sp.]